MKYIECVNLVKAFVIILFQDDNIKRVIRMLNLESQEGSRVLDFEIQ